MTCLRQHFSRRVFTNIFAIIFTHYNVLRDFVNTFGVNAHDDLSPSLRSRGYINSFRRKVYYTNVYHFTSRGPLTTKFWTSTSTTVTMSTTPSVTEDSIMSVGQVGQGEHTKGPSTTKGEIFCPSLMREDLEAS
jgi:hypothetical protein